MPIDWGILFNLHLFLERRDMLKYILAGAGLVLVGAAAALYVKNKEAVDDYIKDKVLK